MSNIVPDMSEPAPREAVICVPINVDAFVLNEQVCNTGLTRIAPITQPDYRGLRTDNTEMVHDVLPPVDVVHTQPAAINPRISEVEAAATTHVNLATPATDTPAAPAVRANRIGVYVHWSLPRGYRAATSMSDTVTSLPTGEPVSSSPTFRLVPNRWLVVRRIASSVPAAGTGTGNPIQAAWVVESDRLWNVADLGPDVDLQTDVSPFVSYTAGDETDPNTLLRQAQVYIGYKSPSTTWTEQGTAVPRVPLTTMNSSNFCFADNAVHNPNVFSMVDTFGYTDANGAAQTYSQVTCSYLVFGWHASAADDPLGPDGLSGTLDERLQALLCVLENPPSPEDGSATVPVRLLCYGEVTGVTYNRAAKPTTPSDTFAALFTDAVQMEPVSVGTTPLDAVLTFLQAHSANEDTFFGSKPASAVQDILSLRELLYAASDSYNDRSRAADLIYADNFGSAAGGTQWHYSQQAPPGQPPAEPGTVSIDGSGLSPLDYLNKVNNLQAQLDAANRKMTLAQWSLFAVWWEAVSDPQNTVASRVTAYKARVTSLRAELATLNTLINDPSTGLIQQINLIVRNQKRLHGPIILPKVRATSIPQQPFSQRKDPNICIAGTGSGWPTEYLGILPVELGTYFLDQRAASTTRTPTTTSSTQVVPKTSTTPTTTSPAVITNPLASFLPSTSGGTSTTPATTTPIDSSILYAMAAILQYANNGVDHSSEIGFKAWAGQPWCPLYIEWEATYFHVPFAKWSVQLLSSAIGRRTLAQVRYGLTEPLWTDPTAASDTRTVGGRIIVSPQPVVNLAALVGQVLDTAGTPQPTDMTQQTLLDRIAQLQFLSGELDGLTDALLLLADGAHVQPNFHQPGSTADTALQAAIAAGAPFGFTAADIAAIADQSGSTPYGALVDFSKALKDPFKPVTHGQFRFTKLNIVDKFGQVVCGIAPSAPPRVATSALPASLHPCLGDQVSPSLVTVDNVSHLNTVTELTSADPELPTSNYPLCPYVQLTPAINQPARLNAAFVEPTTDSKGVYSGWKATNDWEQPVWAWVVVNYADYGLQFFAADGTFYVELSLGGPTGSIASPKWLPFQPPTNPTNAVSPQLTQLIAKMTDPTTGAVYLRSFWDMITQAVETMPYAPADYAAYASSIIGKPLALVNVGLSLELATAPLQTQTTLPPTTKPDTEPADLLAYSFPLKIGDLERPYDGVLGYFETANSTESAATDWTKLYTYFPHLATVPAQTGDPRVMIEPSTFPTLSPFYVDPTTVPSSTTYTASLAAKYHVKTMLIDPYTALHFYSPILPITTLQLPAWTIQVTLQKMSAFFKLGPNLVTVDVPKTYSASKAVKADDWGSQQQKRPSSSATAPIRLPLLTGKRGVWNWLQPYVVTSTPSDPASRQTEYDAYDVGEDDGRIRLDPAPYTLVEGYLQLAQPLAPDSSIAE